MITNLREKTDLFCPTYQPATEFTSIFSATQTHCHTDKGLTSVDINKDKILRSIHAY